jgi:hypothetical protein
MDCGKHASELAKNINILDSIKFISKAWLSIKSDTIIKCFVNCGFTGITSPNNSRLTIQDTFEMELKDAAKKIGIKDDDLIFEESIPDHDLIDESTILDIIIKEYDETVNDTSETSTNYEKKKN